ncbi:MAG: rhodanese-like domain-containing protein [Gemmatimonadales bacterium]
MSDKTNDKIISEARARTREVQAADVKAMLARGENVVYLDVREPNEFNLGHLPAAVHVPLGSLELRVEAAVPRDARIVTYCSAGVRSVLAADTLQRMGYADVVSMAGGLRAYVATGAPVEG